MTAVIRCTTGDLEKLLGIKGHIIRYWERQIPLIQPQKDDAGNFMYSAHDVQLLMRVKHFLYDRKFTIEGALEELYREYSSEDQDARAMIAELRSDLLNIYLINHKRI
ncbi:MAG: MerR family transcriptional regulator [Spirochaetaceae bacterium]|jgi:DNA-binding transcriptional MerR regulator|nr:MerR family transcriptional regulator [Spirochaetaceae bacterium]